MAKKLLGLAMAGMLLVAQVTMVVAAPLTSGGLVKAGGGEALPVVSASERSKHFDAVSRQLELGGALYGYVDIDGDAQRLADFLKVFTKSMAAENPQMAMLQQDFGAIFADLGLSDVKAAGLSSVEATPGVFRNRVFLYMPDGRHGLFAGLGGAPAPYKHLKLAPANADIYAEGEIDLPAAYNAVHGVVTRVAGAAGANAMETGLRNTGSDAGVSALGIIQNLKGHIAAVVRLDADKPVQIPGRDPFFLPNISLLLRIDGIATQIAPLLEQVGGEQGPFKRTEANGRTIFEMKGPLPFGDLQPFIVLEGDDVMIATNRAFFDSCVGTKDRLSDTPKFRELVAPLGNEGNGFFYATPRLATELHRLKELNKKAPAQVQRSLELMLSQIPKYDVPLCGVRINRPDGVLFVNTLYRSLKQDLAAVAVYNPVTLGLMAGMAFPAFNKVKSSSNNKVIQNNLRMLHAAGNQYCLENSVTSATYEQLVGPGKYIEQLKPVAGEDYTGLVFKTDASMTVTTADGKEFSIDPNGELSSPAP